MAIDEPAGMVEIEVLEDRQSARVGEGHVAEANADTWQAARGSRARGDRAGLCHGPFEPQHGRDRRRRAVHGPVEAAERDHRDADGTLREHDRFAEREGAARGGPGEPPEHHQVGANHEQRADEQRLFAEPGGLELQFVQTRPTVHESRERPVRETKKPKFLGGRGIDSDAIRVVGVPLRAPDDVGVSIEPDAAFPQQPVCSQPGAGQQERRPPGVRGQHHGRRHTSQPFDEAAGDEVHRDEQRRTGHPEIEVPCHGEVGGQPRILEMPHARREGGRVRQPVVQPRGEAIAEVGAERLVDRSQALQQDEDRAGKGEGPGQRRPALHGADEHAHRDAERGRQHPARDQHGPPSDREPSIRLREHAEKLPFLPIAQPLSEGHRPGSPMR